MSSHLLPMLCVWNSAPHLSELPLSLCLMNSHLHFPMLCLSTTSEHFAHVYLIVYKFSIEWFPVVFIKPSIKHLYSVTILLFPVFLRYIFLGVYYFLQLYLAWNQFSVFGERRSPNHTYGVKSNLKLTRGISLRYQCLSNCFLT